MELSSWMSQALTGGFGGEKPSRLDMPIIRSPGQPCDLIDWEQKGVCMCVKLKLLIDKFSLRLIAGCRTPTKVLLYNRHCSDNRERHLHQAGNAA